MSTIRIAAAVCFLLAMCRVTLAQQTPATADTPPPRYNVEIVVFAHTDFDPAEERFETDEYSIGETAGNGTTPRPESVIAVEPFGPSNDTGGPFGSTTPGRAIDAGLPGPPPRATDNGGFAGAGPETGAGARGTGMATGPAAGDGLELLDPFGTLASGPADTTEEDPALTIRALTPEELTLGDAERIIDRLGAYRLLGHGGWQQPGLDEAHAIPVDLSRVGITNPTGTVRLYLGRFLHVGLDLSYRAPMLPQAPFPAAGGNAQAAQPGTPDFVPGRRRLALAEIPLPERYHLRAERNAIRSGELHYIDHPRFGVLILVTPAPPPGDEAAEIADDSPSA